jgi:hypothetical protein
VGPLFTKSPRGLVFSETYTLRWCCSQLRFFFPVAQATSRQDYEHHHQHSKAEHSIWTAKEEMRHKILRFCKKGVYVDLWAALSCTP